MSAELNDAIKIRMESIIVISPLLRKRFAEIVKWCIENHGKKPDNVSWDEVAFVRMLVLSEDFYLKKQDLVH